MALVSRTLAGAFCVSAPTVLSTRMDELELRIAALELLLIEVVPHVERSALDAACHSIQAGLDVASDSDEVAIRRQALTLVQEGRDRFKGPGFGGRLFTEG